MLEFMDSGDLKNIGASDELKLQALQEVVVGKTKIALTYLNGKFSAVSGVCNHAGGPLGKGRLDGEYIVYPWHNWKFHCKTGAGEPGFEQDHVPEFQLTERKGHLWIDLSSATARTALPHPKRWRVRLSESPEHFACWAYQPLI